jgi:hypothetical protein
VENGKLTALTWAAPTQEYRLYLFKEFLLKTTHLLLLLFQNCLMPPRLLHYSVHTIVIVG